MSSSREVFKVIFLETKILSCALRAFESVDHNTPHLFSSSSPYVSTRIAQIYLISQVRSSFCAFDFLSPAAQQQHQRRWWWWLLLVGRNNCLPKSIISNSSSSKWPRSKSGTKKCVIFVVVLSYLSDGACFLRGLSGSPSRSRISCSTSNWSSGERPWCSSVLSYPLSIYMPDIDVEAWWRKMFVNKITSKMYMFPILLSTQ